MRPRRASAAADTQREAAARPLRARKRARSGFAGRARDGAKHGRAKNQPVKLSVCGTEADARDTPRRREEMFPLFLPGRRPRNGECDPDPPGLAKGGCVPAHSGWRGGDGTRASGPASARVAAPTPAGACVWGWCGRIPQEQVALMQNASSRSRPAPPGGSAIPGAPVPPTCTVTPAVAPGRAAAWRTTPGPGCKTRRQAALRPGAPACRGRGRLRACLTTLPRLDPVLAFRISAAVALVLESGGGPGGDPVPGQRPPKGALPARGEPKRFPSPGFPAREEPPGILGWERVFRTLLARLVDAAARSCR